MSYSFIFGLFVFTILVAIIVSNYSIKEEKKLFNDGKCSDCGCELIYFDENNLRGRGYKCAICNKVVWISWAAVDEEFLERE